MAEEDVEPIPPIVVDLGRVKRRRMKELKEGRGPLLDEVHEAVSTVRAELGEDADSKELVPVVILYERKRKKKKGIFLR